MSSTELRHLDELVDFADISVRVSSELRLLLGGRPVQDREAFSQAISFLSRARSGGLFLSGTQGSGLAFDGFLKPLTWATDAFLRSRPQVSRRSPDYRALAEYVDGLAGCLQDSLVNTPRDNASLEDAIRFFQGLGRILSSRADQALRGDEERLNPMMLF